jgi:hypothetical protein
MYGEAWMSGGREFNEAALWRRWRDGTADAAGAAAEPDALSLAAYAERRLGRPDHDPEADPAIAAVELWLAQNPEFLADIEAARSPSEGLADPGPIARAEALVARPGGNVVGLPPRRDWRHTMAWGGIAASLAAAIVLGFSLGNNNVVELSDLGPAQVLEQPLIGAQSSFLAADDEESGI